MFGALILTGGSTDGIHVARTVPSMSAPAVVERRTSELAQLRELLLVLLVATIPLAMGTVVWSAAGGADDFNRRVSISPFDIPLAMLLVVALVDRRRIGNWRGWRLFAQIAAALAVVLAIAFVAHPSPRGVDFAFRIAAGLAVIDAFVRLGRLARDHVFAAIAAVGVIESIIAMAESAHGGAVGLGPLEYRGFFYTFGSSTAGHGGFDHPYHLAFFLLVALGATLIGARRAATRMPWLAAAAICSAGIAVTYSRAALLSLVTFAAVALLARGSTDRKRALRGLAAMVAIGFVFGAIAFGDGWHAKGARSTSSANVDSDRRVRAQEALRLIDSQPLLGVGPGRYTIALESVRHDDLLPAHNIVLHEGAEGGVLAGILTALLLIALAVYVFREGARDHGRLPSAGGVPRPRRVPVRVPDRSRSLGTLARRAVHGAHRNSQMTEQAQPRLDWREIAKWALLGTLVISVWVLFDVERSGRNALNFIQPGAQGPSAAVFHEDFPKVQLPNGLGLDGQQYYAVARDPFHPTQVAPLLDRPRYRLQRPLLPWLAWLVHPTGGGYGLVWAFVLVGILGILLGSLATGALAVQLGGRPWLAIAFAITPGAWFSLRASVADALALGLAIAAIACAHRERWWPAVLFAVAAVLAKEVIIFVLAGWVLWKWLSSKSRTALLLVAVPAAVALGWWIALRVMLPGHEAIGELGAPFVGWRDAWHTSWSHGKELVGMAAAIGSAIVGVAALVRRGLKHPLGWAIAFNLALAALENGDVIGNNYGSTRALMPVLVLGIVAFFTVGHPLRVDTSPEHMPTGIVGPGRGIHCGLELVEQHASADRPDRAVRTQPGQPIAIERGQPRRRDRDPTAHLIDWDVEQRLASLGRIESSRQEKIDQRLFALGPLVHREVVLAVVDVRVGRPLVGRSERRRRPGDRVRVGGDDRRHLRDHQRDCADSADALSREQHRGTGRDEPERQRWEGIPQSEVQRLHRDHEVEHEGRYHDRDEGQPPLVLRHVSPSERAEDHHDERDGRHLHQGSREEVPPPSAVPRQAEDVRRLRGRGHHEVREAGGPFLRPRHREDEARQGGVVAPRGDDPVEPGARGTARWPEREQPDDEPHHRPRPERDDSRLLRWPTAGSGAIARRRPSRSRPRATPARCVS